MLMSGPGSRGYSTIVLPEDDDGNIVPGPSPSAVRRADQIIRVQLGLVSFVVVIGTIGNLADHSIRVDVALVTALLGALATYAIVGKFKDK